MGAYWWTDRPGENLFMEITRGDQRNDYGHSLNAPLAARHGVETPGYSLVGQVRAGDIVVHYDSSAEQITGVSRATGDRTQRPIWWVARGTYARKAGEQAKWLPGFSVALEGYRPLHQPLKLVTIRERRDAILALRSELQAEHPGASIYYPWIPYQDTVRTFQSYLAKFPQTALDVLPEVRAAVDELLGDAEFGTVEPPEVEEAERQMASAAGRPRKPRRGRGQGFATDTAVKSAIEAHAMNLAHAHYVELGAVKDNSRTESYDYEVTIDKAVWHVEVKGTTGSAEQILLTPNEVVHAQEYPHVALVVVGDIQIDRDADGNPQASGGSIEIHHPWVLEPAGLSAVGYKYRIPTRHSRSGR